ncbi:MAG TPA: hypothetical protein VD860_10165 [Azospirillum sp.]|nr:hypothetical protein [Azospirillum sp.]
MGSPVSVRLDDDVQATLESAAQERGVGLSTYLRELAVVEAKRVRRERIRAQSRAVGDHIAATPEARSFYEDWGTPNAESGT